MRTPYSAFVVKIIGDLKPTNAVGVHRASSRRHPGTRGPYRHGSRGEERRSMTLVVVLVVVVVIACVAGLMVARQRRTTSLKEGFGPEYDRAVSEHGDRKVAEAELRERRQRREQYEIRPLEPEARARYEERWRATQ